MFYDDPENRKNEIFGLNEIRFNFEKQGAKIVLG